MFTSYPLDHQNLTVVHFNAYAGGKFWINCLAHHPDAMPLFGKINNQHWSNFDLDATLKHKLKLEHINKSLPPRDKMRDWVRYEHGHLEMWGDLIDGITGPGKCCELTNSLNLLVKYRCFTINHQTNLERFNTIRDNLPTVKHIVLVNARNFQERASVLKGCNFNVPVHDHLLGLDNVFYVDVDNTWFDADITDFYVKQCWGWLGLPEIPTPTLQSYIENYFTLHQ
jgi:hypothetical protein